jgi:DNA-binding transcriptional MerR regulator
MAEKSEQAFRTISEVADQLDLPQHVLRFWETKFRQIEPMKRGGGRRYYRPQDVELIRRIKSLLHVEGYTIKGVQRMLGQGGVHKLPEAPKDQEPKAPQSDHAAAQPSPDLALIVSELEDIRDLLKKSVV